VRSSLLYVCTSGHDWQVVELQLSCGLRVCMRWFACVYYVRDEYFVSELILARVVGTRAPNAIFCLHFMCMCVCVCMSMRMYVCHSVRSDSACMYVYTYVYMRPCERLCICREARHQKHHVTELQPSFG
jgi:hypothetical protein